MPSAVPFTFAGVALIADSGGALYWPGEATLVVSDLHLEKGSALAERRCRHMPPYDTRQTLAELAGLIRRYQPRRVVCLGDSFHDGGAPARMAEEDCRVLRALTAGRDWIWIAGNHDPAPPECFGGRVTTALTLGAVTLGALMLGRLVFVHKAGAGGAPEISGHYHPRASVVVRDSRVSGRCFAFDETRLIMPSFGAYTGGLNVLDPAIATLLAPDFHVAIIGRSRVVRLPRRKLAA